MTDIMFLYWQYVLGYAILAGLVSFAVIYRWGGVSNPRTFDLIQWFLQLIGMVLVYLSTSSLVLSLGVMVLVTLVYALPLRYEVLWSDLCTCSHHHTGGPFYYQYTCSRVCSSICLALYSEG